MITLKKRIKARSELFKKSCCDSSALGRWYTDLFDTEEQSARLMKMLKDHFTIADNAEVSMKWTHARLNSTCLIIYAILVLTESVWAYKDFNKAVQAVNREQDESL